MKKNAGNMVVWVLIVVVVIGILVYLTINRDENLPSNSQLGQVEQSINNMEHNVDGVQVAVLKEGTGEPVKAGDTVAMNYTGKLSDGTVFDSNTDPSFGHVEPFVFTLGSGQVIRGWDVGIVGMKMGEIRSLVISPEFGYGAAGAGAVIPPNAVLNFEVELVAVQK